MKVVSIRVLFGVLMYFCRWVELACHLVCHVVSAHLLGVAAVGVLFNLVRVK